MRIDTVYFMKSILVFLIASTLLHQTCFGTTSLSGDWQIQCKDGLIKEQHIQDNFVKSTESFFSDKLCQKLSFIFETAGTVSFERHQQTWIDFKYSSVRLTVFIDSAITDLNTRQVCGFDNWTSGNVKDITGLHCALFNENKETQIPMAGEMKYGIYRMIDTMLFYGELTIDHDGSSAATRPIEFSQAFYTKIVN